MATVVFNRGGYLRRRYEQLDRQIQWRGLGSQKVASKSISMVSFISIIPIYNTIIEHEDVKFGKLGKPHLANVLGVADSGPVVSVLFALD